MNGYVNADESTVVVLFVVGESELQENRIIEKRTRDTYKLNFILIKINCTKIV